jgi:hypothetical protein
LAWIDHQLSVEPTGRAETPEIPVVVVLNNFPPEYVAIPLEKVLIGCSTAAKLLGVDGVGLSKSIVVTPPTVLAEPLVSQGVNEAADAESATAPRTAPNTVRKATDDFMIISIPLTMATIRLFIACLVNGPFGLIIEPRPWRRECKLRSAGCNTLFNNEL